MALPNKDELAGKFDQAKGSIKSGLGGLTNDHELQAEGEADKTSGDVQEGWGKVKRGVSETVDKIGDTLSDAANKINK